MNALAENLDEYVLRHCAPPRAQRSRPSKPPRLQRVAVGARFGLCLHQVQPQLRRAHRALVAVCLG